MIIWSGEIKEIEKLHESVKGDLPVLAKELEQLIKTVDANVVMLYSRRCLEVIVTDLCECELKRPRKTEPLKGIIDKLNSEEKVPSHIITSMHGLNSLSTYGTHPKDFDLEQVKPALNNLTIVIKWYLKYKELIGSETEKYTPERTVSSFESTTKKELLKHKRRLSKLPAILLLIILVGASATIAYFVIRENRNYENLEKSIAVLPFRNDSTNDSTQYFMDGVMEELLNNLQKIKDLRVIGRTSVEQYRTLDKTIPEIAKELGVNYIVEGSGQKSGNSFRMRVQLIRAKKESHLWAKSFERKNLSAKEYFNIQSQFAKDIGNELNAAITPREKQLIEKIPTKDLTAYEAYLKGRFYLYKATESDLDTAMQYFELAKEKDPEFALAYTGIGDVWLFRQQFWLATPDEAGPKLMAAVERALELDSTLAEVYHTLAGMNVYGMWDWKAGEEAFKKAIAMNPNYADAHALYSHLLNILGREEEAMEHIELALKLDPHNPMVKVWYSQDLLFVNRYDDVISVNREVFEKNPTMFIALDGLFQALNLTGRYEEAFEAIKLYFCNMHFYKDMNHVFDQYAKLGYAGTLNLEADTLSEQSKSMSFAPTDFAYLYIFAGNKERALECLEQCYEWHDSNMPYITGPTYDSLRDEPRFQELCRKMNIPCNN